MRTTKLTAVAALAALMLTGCAGLRPGVAAEVGEETITIDRLDAFAEGLCAFQPDESVTATRRLALRLLVRAHLAHEYASGFSSSVVPADIDETVRVNVAPAVESLSEDDREVFLDEVRDSIEGDLLAQQAALAGLGVATQPTPEEVQNASNALYAEWSEEAGVELDPRFGTWQDANVSELSGSLSVLADPVAEPDPGLPGSRSCSS